MFGFIRIHERLLVLVLTILAVPACASTYRLPAETIALRSKLDAAKATEIIAASLLPDSSDKGGAVAAGPNRLPAWNVYLGDGHIDFMAHGLDEVTGITPGIGGMTAQTASTQNQYRIDLNSITKIRIQETDGDDPLKKQVPGNLVWIHGSLLNLLIVNIPKTRLNDLIAALTFFSPGVKLQEGTGF